MKKIVIASLLFLTACHNADVGEATRQAKEFMKKISGATAVECNPTDSDGDGYISCTVFRGSADPLPIQCGAENYCVFNCAHGCRMAIPTTRRAQ